MSTNSNQLFAFMQNNGATNESLYALWKTIGHEGGYEEFIEYMRTGPKGDTGVGMSAYEEWKTIEGNEEKTFEDFIVAITGPGGESVYDTWLSLGYEGTAEDFLAFMKGEKGDAGESTYDIWKTIEGNEKKSITDFIADLKGEKGDKGDAGESTYDVWKSIEGNEDKTVTDFIKDLKTVDDGIVTTNETTLVNSKEGGLRLVEMTGNTEQKTLSGKNLLPNNMTTQTINGLSFVVNDDGSVNVSGTSTIHGYYTICNSFTFDSTVEYWLSGCPTGGSDSTYMLGCFKDNNVLIWDVGAGKLISNTSDTYDIVLYVYAGCTINGVIKPMITLNSVEDKSYEPYCGSTPSPNPEYPQAIHNTGDCVELMQGAYLYESGIYSNKTMYICNKYKIPCKRGDIIKCNFENENIYFHILFYNDNNYISNIQNITNHEVIIPDNGANYFSINVMNNNYTNITPETVGKVQLTVNGKYVTQIVEHGKNLLNPSRFTNHFVDKELITSINSEYVLSELFDSGEYIVSCSNKSELAAYIYVIYYDRYKKVIHRDLLSVNNANIFKLSNTNIAPYFRIMYAHDKSKDARPYDVQLEESKVATLYEPYKEHISTIYTNEPIRKGDVVFKEDNIWKVERNIKEVVFDGSDDENWNTSKDPATNVIRFEIILGLSKIGFKTSLCTHFRNINYAWADTKYGVYGDHNTGQTRYFRQPNENITTLEEWKAWVAENKPVLQYTLKTPTYEVLDDDSQLALNKLQTFNNITYLEADSRIKPESITSEYGTTKLAAYTLKSLNNDDIDYVERKAMKAEMEDLKALVASLTNTSSTTEEEQVEESEVNTTEPVEEETTSTTE